MVLYSMIIYMVMKLRLTVCQNYHDRMCVVTGGLLNVIVFFFFLNLRSCVSVKIAVPAV